MTRLGKRPNTLWAAPVARVDEPAAGECILSWSDLGPHPPHSTCGLRSTVGEENNETGWRGAKAAWLELLDTSDRWKNRWNKCRRCLSSGGGGWQWARKRRHSDGEGRRGVRGGGGMCATDERGRGGQHNRLRRVRRSVCVVLLDCVFCPHGHNQMIWSPHWIFPERSYAKSPTPEWNILYLGYM